MRIALLAYGSRGDVQPFVALGAALVAQGHTVVLAAPERFAPLAAAHGLAFAGLPGDIDALSRGLVDQAGNSPLGQLGLIFRHAIPIAVEGVARMRAAVRQAGLIVHGFGTLGAGHLLAQELGVPDVAVQLFPFFVPYPQFPNVTISGDFGPRGNRLSHQISTWIFKQSNLLSYRWLQRRYPELGAAQLAWPEPGRTIPLLLAYSPLLVGPTPKALPLARATGFWTLEPGPYTPPPDLVAFLADGPAPIFVGFGSMITRHAATLTATILAVAGQQRRRVIMQRGWAELGAGALPPWVLLIDDIPHAWLFPQLAGIIHHGGAGTTAAALRAGVPSLTVPFTADQPFWGWRTHQLGVGPAPLPVAQCNATTLAPALASMDDPAIKRKAVQVGAALRAEQGVATASKVLADTLLHHCP